MSASAWAALFLLLFVALFLGGLFWLVHRHYLDQRRRDGGRSYDRAEGTDWFSDPERLERIRERWKETRAEPRDVPPPRKKRDPRETYGERVTGGDDE